MIFPLFKRLAHGSARSMLRDRWLWNHLARTIAGVLAFVCSAVAVPGADVLDNNHDLHCL